MIASSSSFHRHQSPAITTGGGSHQAAHDHSEEDNRKRPVITDQKHLKRKLDRIFGKYDQLPDDVFTRSGDDQASYDSILTNSNGFSIAVDCPPSSSSSTFAATTTNKVDAKPSHATSQKTIQDKHQLHHANDAKKCDLNLLFGDSDASPINPSPKQHPQQHSNDISSNKTSSKSFQNPPRPQKYLKERHENRPRDRDQATSLPQTTSENFSNQSKSFEPSSSSHLQQQKQFQQPRKFEKDLMGSFVPATSTTCSDFIPKQRDDRNPVISNIDNKNSNKGLSVNEIATTSVPSEVKIKTEPSRKKNKLNESSGDHSFKDKSTRNSNNNDSNRRCTTESVNFILDQFGAIPSFLAPIDFTVLTSTIPDALQNNDEITAKKRNNDPHHHLTQKQQPFPEGIVSPINPPSNELNKNFSLRHQEHQRPPSMSTHPSISATSSSALVVLDPDGGSGYWFKLDSLSDQQRQALSAKLGDKWRATKTSKRRSISPQQHGISPAISSVGCSAVGIGTNGPGRPTSSFGEGVIIKNEPSYSSSRGLENEHQELLDKNNNFVTAFPANATIATDETQRQNVICDVYDDEVDSDDDDDFDEDDDGDLYCRPASNNSNKTVFPTGVGQQQQLQQKSNDGDRSPPSFGLPMEPAAITSMDVSNNLDEFHSQRLSSAISATTFFIGSSANGVSTDSDPNKNFQSNLEIIVKNEQPLKGDQPFHGPNALSDEWYNNGFKDDENAAGVDRFDDLFKYHQSETHQQHPATFIGSVAGAMDNNFSSNNVSHPQPEPQPLSLLDKSRPYTKLIVKLADSDNSNLLSPDGYHKRSGTLRREAAEEVDKLRRVLLHFESLAFAMVAAALHAKTGADSRTNITHMATFLHKFFEEFRETSRGGALGPLSLFRSRLKALERLVGAIIAFHVYSARKSEALKNYQALNRYQSKYVHLLQQQQQLQKRRHCSGGGGGGGPGCGAGSVATVTTTSCSNTTTPSPASSTPGSSLLSLGGAPFAGGLGGGCSSEAATSSAGGGSGISEMISIPTDLFKMQCDQLSTLSHLMWAEDMWREGITTSQQPESREFFQGLDQLCGKLDLWSTPLTLVADYLYTGVIWLRREYGLRLEDLLRSSSSSGSCGGISAPAVVPPPLAPPPQHMHSSSFPPQPSYCPNRQQQHNQQEPHQPLNHHNRQQQHPYQNNQQHQRYSQSATVPFHHQQQQRHKNNR